jgi:hypothetical protein
MSTEQSQPMERVSIVLKNNGHAAGNVICTMCEKTTMRTPVDYVIEGTLDHVCQECADRHDDMLQRSAHDARGSSFDEYGHRRRVAAVWRAALILKQADSGAFGALGPYIDHHLDERQIPDDVREQLAAQGLNTLDEIFRKWSWGKYEETLPF